ncbi:MAG: DUF2911 domain-containing protein [Bacteroidota bacterium]
MKNLLRWTFMFALLFGFSQMNAQIQTPAPSPKCKTEQMVGLTTISLDYSRPSVKGRELFVDVESFGNIWRTGANASTKIKFSDDVKIEGKEVPAGEYALYSIPGREEWTIMLYKDLKLGGYVAKYDEANELMRFKVKPTTGADHIESFLINFDHLKSNSAHIVLMWGKYQVPFKVETEVDSRVMKQIDMAMAGPSRGEYYTAASYYYNNDKDMKKALTWVKKANEIDEKFWQLRMQALILAKLGRHSEAIATAEKSTQLAVAAENAGYPKMNAKSIAEWKAAMAGSKVKSSGKK